MNTEDMQARVDAMAAAMVAKGLRAPEAQYWIRSNVQSAVMLSFGKLTGATHDYERDYHHFPDDDGSGLAKADAFIAGLPDAAERRRADFMEQLTKTIEMGRQNGIDADFVNPLVEAMKRLSENIITDQR